MKTTKFCPNCNAAKMHETDSANHITHLLCSIIFFPWLVIWLWRALIKRPVKCLACGCDNQ